MGTTAHYNLMTLQNDTTVDLEFSRILGVVHVSIYLTCDGRCIDSVHFHVQSAFQVVYKVAGYPQMTKVGLMSARPPPPSAYSYIHPSGLFLVEHNDY